VWPLRMRSTAKLQRAADMLRITLALVLALSGLWLMIAPRADQPLIDGIEAIVPRLRSAYMRDPELDTWRDADEHVRRYAQEIDQLNEREARSRWQGQALDDLELRKISSFLKSYGEMRNGEAFVMREVRARSRERVRWLAGIVMLLIALAIVPWRKWWSRAGSVR
jgi:zinc/manganese transport system permease protein